MAGETGDPEATALPSPTPSSPDLDSPAANGDVELVAKAAHIVEACDARNLDLLTRLASEEGGFVRDELRQKACT